MPNRLVRRSLVAALGALSVVAVGCGATGTAGDGPAQLVSSGVAPQAASAAGVAEAAQATGAVSSLRFELSVRTTPAGGDPSVTVTSSGEVDAAAGRSHVTADIAGLVGGESEAGTVEAVTDGGTVYLQAPFTSLVADTPWIKVTSPKLADLASRLGEGLRDDPGSFLELLEGAGGPVTTLGTEDVRGVATRHVAVDLEVAEVLAQADPDRRAAIEDHLARRGVDLSELAPLPAEAWIDDDGLVRRFTVSFDLAELRKLDAEADATGVVTETVELYDFDAPVSIELPPADQVTELDLAGLLDGRGPASPPGGRPGGD